MKNPIHFLEDFRDQLTQWLEKPTVGAPADTMMRIRSAVEVSIELLKHDRKIMESEKHLFEGGIYLVHFFDGWGNAYLQQYLEMVEYIQQNHY